MDPNHWNYNQAYSRISPGHSLPTSHAGINRIDFPLLDQATIGSGLGLPPSLPPHANLTSRSLGGLPGVNYPGHPIHTGMSQFLDPMTQLQAGFSTQPTYKPMPVAQSPFSFDSPGRSSSDIAPSFSPGRYTGTPSLSTHPKPGLFSPELAPPKEMSFSSPPPPSLTETSPKGWGLSNFLPSPPISFGNLSDSGHDFVNVSHSQSQHTPPPAHSASGRVTTIQRTPYSADSLFTEHARPKSTQPVHSSRDTLPFTSSADPMFTDHHRPKSTHPIHSRESQPYTSSSGFGRTGSAIQTPKSSVHAPPTPTYTSSPQIQDLSSHSSQMFTNYSSSTYNQAHSSNHGNPVYSSSQLTASMDYDPVSPAPEPPQSNDNNPFSTVSLQDLAVLGTSPPLHEKPHHRDTGMIHSSLKSNRLSKDTTSHVQSIMSLQHTPPSIHNGQSVGSPMQQSPISVGSPQVSSMSVASPQISASLGSPQSLLPSSTVVPTPPPVQAMADSTTKPKRGRGSRGGRGGGGRGRGRKKKDEETSPYLNMHQPQMFPNNMNNIAQQHHHHLPPQHPQTSFGDVNVTTAAYRTDTHQEMNQTYMHSDMPLVDNSMRHQMTPEPLQRSPIQDNLVGVQPMKDMGGHRLPMMQEELHSQHSSMSSLNSGHQPSPMHDQMGVNHQAFCDTMVGQHSSPLANSSPPNQMTMDNSHLRNTDNSSMTSHSALSDSSMDQRGSVLTSVRESEAILAGADQYNMNGFVDTPFIDQLAATPPSVSQPMEYQQQAPMLMDMNNHNSYQDTLTGGMHMSQFGNSFPLQEQHMLDMNPVDTGTTIDEATFSSLFGSPQPERVRHRTKAEQKVPIMTITTRLDQDEELCHLAYPPMGACEPMTVSKEEEKRNAFGNSFQDSYLCYILGKKQETLESLSSATIHTKPVLPKYIPEPRRPRPSTPSRSDKRGSGSSGEGSESDYDYSGSDSDDSVTKTINNVASQMSDENSSDKPKPKGALTLKISMSALRNAAPKIKRSRGSKSPKIKGSRKGKSKGSLPDGTEPFGDAPIEEEIPIIPPRERISRRAKDKAMEKKKKKDGSSDSSSSDDENIKSITKEDSEKDYDSDKDPVWTPFEVDIRQPTYDDSLPLERPKRFRRTSGKSRIPRSRNHFPPRPDVPEPRVIMESPAKMPKLSPPHSSSNTDSKSSSSSADAELFAIGKFILEKKDMDNYESYPIWKIEQGRMIHKYEIFTEEGTIRHKAVSTYSSWMPTMKDQFLPIKVNLISNRNLVEIVEVLEECRPKPPTDGSLETKYEDDPLVDLFNVYLQIFLSQALEPGFLSAITDAQDNFYLSALEKIDKLISKKLEDIDKRIKWKPAFKESLKIKPQLREIDRPNLKQSCQACENSSPPTIRTVHFLGNPYDRFDLDELPETGDICTEFMIGKTAAVFVGTYHNLHHFKYHLYKRCLAKVKLLKDTNKGISNEKLLDDCLHNRAWVLKIFEDLKRMLEKG